MTQSAYTFTMVNVLSRMGRGTALPRSPKPSSDPRRDEVPSGQNVNDDICIGFHALLRVHQSGRVLDDRVRDLAHVFFGRFRPRLINDLKGLHARGGDVETLVSGQIGRAHV